MYGGHVISYIGRTMVFCNALHGLKNNKIFPKLDFPNEAITRNTSLTGPKREWAYLHVIAGGAVS